MTENYYTRMGGEKAVKQLIERFYDLMNDLDAAHDIRLLQAADLTDARSKLFMFLSDWLGPNSILMPTATPG